ncbi:MAG: hypothetical protein KF817_02080 [Phycisphaeraceae bacterium]|nr:hypothetical protein [Phycisphaeraceae bacterium]
MSVPPLDPVGPEDDMGVSVPPDSVDELGGGSSLLMTLLADSVLSVGSDWLVLSPEGPLPDGCCVVAQTGI